MHLQVVVQLMNIYVIFVHCFIDSVESLASYVLLTNNCPLVGQSCIGKVQSNALLHRKKKTFNLQHC
jgi:hypothetical protein